MSEASFKEDIYRIRRKFFSFWGQTLLIYDASDKLVLYGYMKAFKLKEDMRLFADESMKKELIRISARQIIDFGATYDVYDSVANKHIGALRRSGWKSIIRDEWKLLDPEDQEFGLIQEDSQILALVRRFVTNLIPQSYHVRIGERDVAGYKQHFNPFWLKITADFSADHKGLYDRRLGLAALTLLCLIEGREQ